MFPRLSNPDGSWTFATSSGGKSSKNTVLVFGPVNSAADPIKRRFKGPPLALATADEKSIDEKSKSSFKTPFQRPKVSKLKLKLK